MMKTQLAIFFLFILNTGFSQMYEDCIDALDVCTDIILSNTAGPGNITEDLSFCDLSSLSFEDYIQGSSSWLKYTIASDGHFAFTITPPTGIDIDFLVFKTADGSCDNLVSQRCMFSGETAGATSEPCLGATGLNFTSIDTVEDGGCNLGSDNFLTALEVNDGDVVYLAVLDFSQSSLPVDISYTGTAELCEPLALNERIEEGLRIFPNPTTSILSIVDISITRAKVSILDLDGKSIDNKSVSIPYQMDVSNISSGVYYLEVVTEKSREIRKVIITEM